MHDVAMVGASILRRFYPLIQIHEMFKKTLGKDAEKNFYTWELIHKILLLIIASYLLYGVVKVNIYKNDFCILNKFLFPFFTGKSILYVTIFNCENNWYSNIYNCNTISYNLFTSITFFITYYWRYVCCIRKLCVFFYCIFQLLVYICGLLYYCTIKN